MPRVPTERQSRHCEQGAARQSGMPQHAAGNTIFFVTLLSIFHKINNVVLVQQFDSYFSVVSD
jgi:hypothetical protein